MGNCKKTKASHRKEAKIEFVDDHVQNKVVAGALNELLEKITHSFDDRLEIVKYLNYVYTIGFHNGKNFLINKNKIPIELFDKNGNLVGSFASVKSASIQTGIPMSSIYDCLKGKSKQHTFKYGKTPPKFVVSCPNTPRL